MCDMPFFMGHDSFVGGARGGGDGGGGGDGLYASHTHSPTPNLYGSRHEYVRGEGGREGSDEQARELQQVVARARTIGLF